jgi:hypothetical protein
LIVSEGGIIRKSTPTYITTGKNIGKSNETNIITQAFRQALGTYNTTISKVASNIVGKDGEESVSIMPPPMLVQKIQNFPLKEQDFIDGITLQKKLNGVHYITFIDENQSIVKYSRGGLIYPPTSMPKITKALLGAVLRHLAGEVTGTQESNVVTTGAGTIFQQAIMRSNIGQELSVSFCKMIH